jgi:Ser/Thr protein kinase RdoA (MazF antagonist)
MGRTAGCVLRYRLTDGAVIYGKVGSAGAIDDVRAALDALARAPGPRAVLFPRLLGHSAEYDLVLLSAVPGRRPLLRSDAAAGTVVGRAALAAATIHASDVVVSEIRTIESEIEGARRTVSLIDEHAPALAGWLTSVIDSVESRASRLSVQAATLGHGDFTPSQLLVDGGRIGVVDFDKVCEAEPALDLGRFLAYLRVTLAKSGLSPSPTIASSLLAAYEAAGGPPTPEARVELYALLSLVLTAVQGWQRLKAGRVQVVCEVLARQCLMGRAPSRRGAARAWPSSPSGGQGGPSSRRGARI